MIDTIKVAKAMREVRPDFRTAMQGEKIIWCEAVVALAEAIARTPGERVRFVRVAGGLGSVLKPLPSWVKARRRRPAEGS